MSRSWELILHDLEGKKISEIEEVTLCEIELKLKEDLKESEKYYTKKSLYLSKIKFEKQIDKIVKAERILNEIRKQRPKVLKRDLML